MAREEKRIELKPVDDSPQVKPAVIRLHSDESGTRAKPIRINEMPVEPPKVSQRLEMPAREDYDSRTHQPGIEALIETDMANPDFLEQEWGKESIHQRQIPWGWFVLIGLIMAGGVIWSLSGGKEAEAKAVEVRKEAASVLEHDAKEDEEAGQLIDKINAATRKFFETTDAGQLADLARQTERVRPLMEAYYGGKPIPPNRFIRTRSMQPLTLDKRTNFWMESVELADRQQHNLIVEILPNGEPRIDWETLVCYQPMKWDDFATGRPEGKSFDFRVYVEEDNFFSHEFAESEKWNCFRLTTRDGEETLFGYAKVDSPISQEILGQLNQNRGRTTSLILRVNIPEGLKSRRGMVIEKMISPRWLYVDPPKP
jgi:hypothetical protein